MPYIILIVLIANLEMIQFGLGSSLFIAVLNIGLLVGFLSREGYLGVRFQNYVSYTPLWLMFATGFAVLGFVIGSDILIDCILPEHDHVGLEISFNIKRILSPLGFVILILAGEVAIHRAQRLN